MGSSEPTYERLIMKVPGIAKRRPGRSRAIAAE